MAFKKGFDENRNPSPPGRGKTMPKRGERGSQIDMLRRALIKAAKAHGGTTLLDRFVEEAYTDNKVLVACVKKLLPDISQRDLNVDHNGKVIIEYVSGINRKLKDEDEEDDQKED